MNYLLLILKIKKMKKSLSKIEKVSMKFMNRNGIVRKVEALKIMDNGITYWHYSRNGKEILSYSKCPPIIMKGLLEKRFKKEGLSYKISLPESYYFN
jgi:hypothetical protein